MWSGYVLSESKFLIEFGKFQRKREVFDELIEFQLRGVCQVREEGKVVKEVGHRKEDGFQSFE